jgi:hypothetical protein
MIITLQNRNLLFFIKVKVKVCRFQFSLTKNKFLILQYNIYFTTLILLSFGNSFILESSIGIFLILIDNFLSFWKYNHLSLRSPTY